MNPDSRQCVDDYYGGDGGDHTRIVLTKPKKEKPKPLKQRGQIKIL